MQEDYHLNYQPEDISLADILSIQILETDRYRRPHQ
jgi:hypothetical protein